MSEKRELSSDARKPSDIGKPSVAEESVSLNNSKEMVARLSRLQQTSQLDEAFELCRQLNEVEHENAEIYGISGVVAFQVGEPDLALELLQKAIDIEPDHAGNLNNLGIVLLETGKERAAIAAYQKAVGVNPNDADAHYNLGNAFAKLERHQEAESAYARAIALRPNFVDALYNRSVMLSALERVEDAAASLRQVTEIAPDFAKAYLQLASVLETLGHDDDALAAMERAAELQPDDVDTIYSKANMLANHRRFDEAASIYRRINEMSPDFMEAYSKLGRALYDGGKRAEAIAPFKHVLSADPNDTRAQYSLIGAVLNGLGVEDLLETCNERLVACPNDRYALAAKAIALNDLGDSDGARDLLDFDRYVREFRLSAPMGYANMEAFNAALAEHVSSHPTLEFEMSGHATRNGGHTDHINVKPEFPVAVLEECIRESVREYMDGLPADPTSPFLSGRPEHWRINMWAVVMQSQGHQVSHIHPSAWLSGVYYPKLPDIIDTADTTKAGWIEFGRPPQVFTGKVEPETMIVQPEEGLMILFPAYFFHRTIPFSSDQTRISIAFDVIPKK